MDRLNYKLKEMCDNCPFAEDGPGRVLRDSLGPGRFKEITQGLKRGEHFFCHKTVNYSDDGEEYGESYRAKGGEKICAGAIEWQAKRGIVADAIQIMDRLAMIKEKQKSGS